MFALQCIQRTLTHLKLLSEDNYTPELHLDRVLDVCSNLVSLELKTSTIHRLTVQYPKLTHLTMETGSDAPFPYDTMMNLLSHMPSLVYLELYPIPDARILTTITGLCPNMKILHCSAYISFPHDNYHHHIDGLQKLSFGLDEVDGPYKGDHLIHILFQHHQSFEYIALAGSITESSALLESRNSDSRLRFGRLQQLVVDARDVGYVKLATFIISRSPHLHSITLDRHTANHDHTCNALKRLPNLRMITAWKIPADGPSFHGLLLHHAQLGMDSSLEELKIDFVVDVPHISWIHVIARLETLRRLVLRTWQINAPSTYLDIMRTLAKGCHSLRSLELDCRHCTIPDGSIAVFKDHSTLEHFRVNASAISDSDIISLISFPDLEHVIIASTIKDYLLELLENHISEVEQMNDE